MEAGKRVDGIAYFRKRKACLFGYHSARGFARREYRFGVTTVGGKWRPGIAGRSLSANKSLYAFSGSGYGTGRYTEGRSGTKHLYFFYRICLAVNGGCAGIFYGTSGKKLLQCKHQRIPYCRSWCQPDNPIGIYSR